MFFLVFMDNYFFLYYLIFRYFYEVNFCVFIFEGMIGNGKYLRI